MSPKLEINGYRRFNEVLITGERVEQDAAGEGTANSTTVHQFFHEAYDDLCSFAQNLVGSRELAQDVVQHAFANTLTAVERGAEIRNISGFLNRCVRNLAIDYMRKTRDHESIDEKIHSPVERSQSTSSELKAQCEEVASAVDDLVPSQRRAFLLAELKGLGYEEIASEMNRSTDSVRMLLCRARRNVRAAVGADRELAGVSAPLLIDQRLLPWAVDPREKWLSWLTRKVSNLQAEVDNWIQNTMGYVAQPSSSVVAGAIVIAVATGPIGSLTGQGSVALDGRSVKESKTFSGPVSVTEPDSAKKKTDFARDDGGEANIIVRGDEPSRDLTRPSNGDDEAGGTKSPAKRGNYASTARQAGGDEHGNGGGHSPGSGGDGDYDGAETIPTPPDPPDTPPGDPPDETEDVPSPPERPAGAMKGAPVPSDTDGNPAQPEIREHDDLKTGEEVDSALDAKDSRVSAYSSIPSSFSSDTSV